MNAALPIPVQAADQANLPANYERARQALAETAKIDECKDWADKAAALASYARQAKDDSLQKMAMKIHGRAVQRAGELLREIEPAPGERTDKPRDGTDPRLTRKSAAEAAGLSERQRKTALNVANIPREQFEQQIESDNPPTVSQLAEMGREHHRQLAEMRREHQRQTGPAKPEDDDNPIGEAAVRKTYGDAAADDPEAFKAATHIAGSLESLLDLYQRSPEPARVVAAMTDRERAALRHDITDLSPFIAGTMQALS